MTTIEQEAPQATAEVTQESLERNPRKGDHTLRIMNSSGDLRLAWDPNNEMEVKIARKAFQRAAKSNMLAYSVNPRNGGKGEVIRDFDPDAEAMIMTPQTVGG